MAISEKQWNSMFPGITKIIDNQGNLWSVLRLLPDPRYTVYVLDRDGDNNPLEYIYVSDKDANEKTVGIVQKDEWAIDTNLNHPDTIIDGTQPYEPEMRWRNTLNPKDHPTVSTIVTTAVDGIAWERGIIFTICHVKYFHGKGFMFRVESIGSMHSGEVVSGTDEEAYQKAFIEGLEVFRNKVEEDKIISDNIAKLP